MNYYKDRVCLNVLAGSHQNAEECYAAADRQAVIGVLSSNYATVEEAVRDMKSYGERTEGNISVGLGGGNPMQWKAVADISRALSASHFNQVFSAVGYTRACVIDPNAHINALVSPSGTPGLVKISTGPLSQHAPDAVIPVETAIAMVKEMGGNALKLFPIHGLQCREELLAVAKACAKEHFILEPTGGIRLENFEELMRLLLDTGVPKIIPHVYSSIIDPATNQTRVNDVKELLRIIHRLL